MRVAFSVYAALYVVIEIVGYQLEQVSWPEITALDVATAIADALLTVAVLVAVIVALDVLGHRWRRHLLAVRLEQARLATAEWADPAPIGVQSWRAEPLALPAGPSRTGKAHVHSGPVHSGPVYSGPVHPEGAYTAKAWPGDAPEPAARLL